MSSSRYPLHLPAVAGEGTKAISLCPSLMSLMLEIRLFRE